MHCSSILQCVGLGICPPWLRQGFTAIGLKSGHAVCSHRTRSHVSFYIDSLLIYSGSGSQKSLLKAVF